MSKIQAFNTFYLVNFPFGSYKILFFHLSICTYEGQTVTLYGELGMVLLQKISILLL